MNPFKKHYQEVLSTIKLIDTEERFDLYFSRYFGLIFAKMAKAISATPTQVSILSLFVGVYGGYLLYFQDQLQMTLWGSALVTLAGVLDSSDGQLARMTGQSTDLGRIIDGLIDNFVFVACYLAAAFYFLPTYGYWIFALAVTAGYIHSTKAALYEFYKSEYGYLVGKSDSAFIPLTIADLKPKAKEGNWISRMLYVTYTDYTKKQLKLSTRTPAFRELLRNKRDAPGFNEAYRAHNLTMLSWWAWVGGTNVHRTLIMLGCILAMADLYFIIAIVSVIPAIIVNQMQRRADKKLEAVVKAL